MILIIHFGGQTCHLIGRRVRDMGVETEIVPHSITIEEITQKNPRGIILSGGPDSVYQRGSPQINPSILSLNIPLLGICYGLQLIARYGGGKVKNHKKKEFGKAIVSTKKGKLFKGLKKHEQVWMSHGDVVTSMPKDYNIIASTAHCPVAGFENPKERVYGVQFHPEVVHTSSGDRILRNFVLSICKSKKDLSLRSWISRHVEQIKKKVGVQGVVMGVSGGVDSTVAASLLHKAIPNQLHCVFVDHGLLRKNESQEVITYFKKKLKFKHFYYVNASTLFLKKLRGVKDPEKKRKIIGHTFIEVFERKVKQLGSKHKSIRFLGQGTIYPDRVESAQPSKSVAKIKSHHNLTLPSWMKLNLIEPLDELYKDEVRSLGKKLGIDPELVNRHPFPGPGLAIRILGEVTPARLTMVRDADHIFISELKKAKLYTKTWQAFAALLPLRTVGVMGDARTYEYIISLRAVSSKDAMTADWTTLPRPLLERISNRIVNEVRGVNRVVFDITQKPPGTIEYE